MLRALPDGQRAAEVASENWALLGERACMHGVAPYLGWQLGAAGVSPPPKVAAMLLQSTKRTAALARQAREGLAKVLGILQREDIRAIVLKGWPLAVRAYPEPGLRTTTDLDLLVRPSQAWRALEALLAAGGWHTESPERIRYAPKFHEHWPAILGVCPLPVEIHTRAIVAFGSSLEADELFECATEDALDGIPYWRLDPSDEVLYLAAHAAGHFVLRLGWLLDLKLLGTASKIDWKTVRARATDRGFAVCLEFVEHLLERIGVEGIARQDRWLPRLVSKAERPIEEGWLGQTRYGVVIAGAALADTPLRAGGHLFNIALRSNLATNLASLMHHGKSGRIKQSSSETVED